MTHNPRHNVPHHLEILKHIFSRFLDGSKPPPQIDSGINLGGGEWLARKIPHEVFSTKWSSRWFCTKWPVDRVKHFINVACSKCLKNPYFLKNPGETTSNDKSVNFVDKSEMSQKSILKPYWHINFAWIVWIIFFNLVHFHIYR